MWELFTYPRSHVYVFNKRQVTQPKSLIVLHAQCIPTFRNSFWSEGEMQKNCLQQSREYLSILERELKGKKFFGGDAIGLLDIAASYIAHWVGVFQEVAEVNLFNKENHPILWKWSQEFINSNGVKKCLPAREKLVTFFQPRKAAMKAYVKPAV